MKNPWSAAGVHIKKDGVTVALAVSSESAQELVSDAGAAYGGQFPQNASTGRIGAGRYTYNPDNNPPDSPTSTRVDVSPTGKTLPGMPKISIPPKRASDKPPRRRTESGVKASLTIHYRKIIGEESAAVAAFEEDIARMKRDPKIVRFIEALQELEAAGKRRDEAARELGMFVAGEKAR